MADAKRDNNSVTTLIAVSNADGVTPVVLWADPVTHRLLVQNAGGNPAGTNTQIQFNNNGVFGASADFTWNDTTKVLGLMSTDNIATVSTGGELDITLGGDGERLFVSTHNGTSLGSTGGDVAFVLGNGITTGTGGGFFVTAGNGGVTDAQGGIISLFSGSGQGAGFGGDIDIVAGNGGASGGGAAIRFTTGDSGATSGDGGNMFFNAGIANNGTGSGGTLFISAGAGLNGGDIRLQPGAKSGAGNRGHVKIQNEVTGFNAILSTALFGTADRTYTFPDQSGTFAMLTDIPTFPKISASADLTAQNAAVASVVAFTVANDATSHTFNVGGYLTVTAISINTITLQVTYTDETTTARTASFVGEGLTVAAVSATGGFAFPPMTIRAKFNTTITIKTAVVGAGSETYDVGGYIMQIN